MKAELILCLGMGLTFKGKLMQAGAEAGISVPKSRLIFISSFAKAKPTDDLIPNTNIITRRIYSSARKLVQ